MYGFFVLMLSLYLCFIKLFVFVLDVIGGYARSVALLVCVYVVYIEEE